MNQEFVKKFVTEMDCELCVMESAAEKCLEKNGEEDQENTKTNESKKKIYDMINRLDSPESLQRVYKLAQYLYLREE